MHELQPGDRLSELEAVTRDYARFAERAGGISAIAGGFLCLVSFAIGALLPASPVVRICLVTIPIVWLLLKQLMARRYYQRLGRVQALVEAPRALIQRSLVAGVAAIAVLILLGAVYGAGDAIPAVSGLPLPKQAYLVAVIALPLIAWRWLRTPIDLVVGCFLLGQAALALLGRSYPALGPAAILVPAALLMIASGWRDHRDFLRLRRRMDALRAQLWATP